MKIHLVDLVGAGPGDPGLITVKGADSIRNADVVIYDRLAHPAHLKLAKVNAELIYCGKQADRHTLTQNEINQVIVDRALQGLKVCRLKGGDPFVFGRGGEEAEYCRSNGVPFQIIPGVTSAIAAPAYAGIPVTHRDAASSFAVITGHERDDSNESSTRTAGKSEGRRNWANIANAADTLLFLMGVESLDVICSKLLEHGRLPDTPVALVRWGTWDEQETLVTTLVMAVEDVRNAGFKAPAITVIGEVVKLREKLRWFDNRPLSGIRVIVTRAREQASQLTELLREHGAIPLEYPVIVTRPCADLSTLDDALKNINNYQWIVFSSARAVEVFAERMTKLSLDSRSLANTKIAVVGTATAETVHNLLNINSDFVPSRFVSEIVIEEWPQKNMTGVKVLIPRAVSARDFVPEALGDMGATVDIVDAYETSKSEGNREEILQLLENGKVHYLTFTSSSTVTNFIESIGEDYKKLLNRVTIVSIGPITAETARAAGLTSQIVAEDYSISGLVEMISEDVRAKG